MEDEIIAWQKHLGHDLEKDSLTLGKLGAKKKKGKSKKTGKDVDFEQREVWIKSPLGVYELYTIYVAE